MCRFSQFGQLSTKSTNEASRPEEAKFPPKDHVKIAHNGLPSRIIYFPFGVRHVPLCRTLFANELPQSPV